MDKFHALADPNRRRILEILAREGQLSATEIYGQFDVSPSAISQHLKILREARLVRMTRQAQKRIYRIDPSAMLEVADWARQTTQLWQQRFDALDALLKSALDSHVEEQ